MLPFLLSAVLMRKRETKTALSQQAQLSCESRRAGGAAHEGVVGAAQEGVGGAAQEGLAEPPRRVDGIARGGRRNRRSPRAGRGGRRSRPGVGGAAHEAGGAARRESVESPGSPSRRSHAGGGRPGGSAEPFRGSAEPPRGTDWLLPRRRIPLCNCQKTLARRLSVQLSARACSTDGHTARSAPVPRRSLPRGESACCCRAPPASDGFARNPPPRLARRVGPRVSGRARAHARRPPPIARSTTSVAVAGARSPQKRSARTRLASGDIVNLGRLWAQLAAKDDCARR